MSETKLMSEEKTVQLDLAGDTSGVCQCVFRLLASLLHLHLTLVSFSWPG